MSRRTQGFGGNPAVYAPLRGHSGYDFEFAWDEAVPCVADKSFVYSKLNENHSDPEKYTAVCTIVDTGPFTADEIIYGHPHLMPCEIGKVYTAGETVAKAGNKGMVFFNGRRITKEEKLAGSTLGTHLHLQRRACIKVPFTTKGKKYLEDANGKYRKDGFYYEIADYDNGYNGCEPIEFTGELATDHLKKRLTSMIETLSTLRALLKRLLGRK